MIKAHLGNKYKGILGNDTGTITGYNYGGTTPKK